MSESVTKTIEIIVDEKTYISKKMNPKRKGLIIRELFSRVTPDENIKNKETLGNFADLISEDVPRIMWDFVKDEDKQKIGTYDYFLENIDDDSCTNFLKWAFEAVKKINNFLA